MDTSNPLNRFALGVVAASFLTTMSWIGEAATPAGALTLDEAVRIALEQSPRVAAAAAEADAARTEAHSASLARLPSVTLGLEAVRSDHPTQVFSGLLAQEQFRQENFGSVDFETGAFDLTPLNRPDPHTNFRASVMLRQTLWSGGAVTGRLDAARHGADAAESMAARTREQIVFETEMIFRNALLAEEQLRLLRGSLAVAEGHAARVRSLYEEGLALQSDRKALEAHVAEVRARLSAAAADSVEARSLLGVMLGAGGPVPDVLVDPKRQEGSAAPLLSEALERTAERSDVRAAESAHRAAGAGKKMAWSRALPAIEIGAGTEHNSEDFFGEGGDQWMIMLGARLQFDPGVPSALRSASHRERAARLQAAQARDGAAHEVVTAHARRQSAQGRDQALQAAVEAAREAFRLTESRHREGLATTLELTESQNTLTRTELEAAAARHDAALAESAYLLAAGGLLIQEDRR